MKSLKFLFRSIFELLFYFLFFFLYYKGNLILLCIFYPRKKKQSVKVNVIKSPNTKQIELNFTSTPLSITNSSEKFITGTMSRSKSNKSLSTVISSEDAYKSKADIHDVYDLSKFSKTLSSKVSNSQENMQKKI